MFYMFHVRNYSGNVNDVSLCVCWGEGYTIIFQIPELFNYAFIQSQFSKEHQTFMTVIYYRRK
jgi:hypothetical protein